MLSRSIIIILNDKAITPV